MLQPMIFSFRIPKLCEHHTMLSHTFWTLILPNPVALSAIDKFPTVRGKQVFSAWNIVLRWVCSHCLLELSVPFYFCLKAWLLFTWLTSDLSLLCIRRALPDQTKRSSSPASCFAQRPPRRASRKPTSKVWRPIALLCRFPLSIGIWR